jgi:hypothetical protein
MAAPQQIQLRDVQKVLTGQPIEQVAFAENVVMVGANEGGVINIAPPGQQAADRIRPRRHPPRISLRAIPGFVGRAPEQGRVSQALARREVVDLHAPDGMGKTALISQTLVTALTGAFPGGMVYLGARRDTYEDLLQALFERFFETDGHVKVGEDDVRDYMADKQALIVVDDANYLKEGEAGRFVHVVPKCALLLAARKQQFYGGVSLPLQELPRNDAVALFERHWGPVSPEDRPTVAAICDALGNVPLPIVKAADIAAARHVPLQEMLRWLQRSGREARPLEQAFRVLAQRLSDGERRTLGSLAALGTATMGFDALVFVSGMPAARVNRYLARLQQMGLVHADDSRYGLDDGLRPYVRRAWADEAMRARAAEYYGRRAGRLRARSKDPDEENVLAALGYYFQRKQWQNVVDMVRAMDSYLATAGRWGQWRRRLNQAWHAAREVGDRAAEAWAQNQLGVIALSAGDKAAAVGFFKGALSIWQALGDRAGATIARWNLQVLLGPATPPGRDKPKDDGRPPRKGPLEGMSPAGKFLITGGTIFGLILVGIFLALLPRACPPPPPPSVGPPWVTTTFTPTPTPSTSTPTPTPTPWTSTPTPTPTPTPTHKQPAPVAISFFRAEPDSIMEGQCTVLEWGAVTGASAITIDQGIGAVSAPGSRPVCPSTTTSYIMTAAGPGGKVTALVTVSVAPEPFVAEWSVCEWIGVHQAGVNSHQPVTWCPEEHYLVGLDLDREASYSAMDSPVVGQAKCCGLADMRYDRTPFCAWIGVEREGINSHQPLEWCPDGRYLVGLDLDREGSYSPLDSPVIGQAQCCTLPDARFDSWASCAWVGVHRAGVNSHQPQTWCPDGSFLTAFDLDRESSYSASDSPIVGQALCCGPSEVHVPDTEGPIITGVIVSPQYPGTDDVVCIQATITDMSGVDRAELWHRHIPDVGVSQMITVLMERIDDVIYRACVGPFSKGDLSYGITAWDTEGNSEATYKLWVTIYSID